MAGENPWLRSTIIAGANVNVSLLTLLQALDADAPKFVQALQIQADPDGGAARWRIGNSAMTDTDFGVLLFATQAFGISSVEQNLIGLRDIYIRCDTAGLRIAVSLVRR